jgi:hypothetical protein
MPESSEPLERLEFDARELMSRYPARWDHPNKQIVAGIAYPPGARAEGTLVYSRWQAMRLPERVDVGVAAKCLTDVGGFYDYEPSGVEAAMEWHVNFADPHLFVAYASSLFAQDEMQVAEHPALGSLREALTAQGRRGVTVEGGSPTPVVISGVERRCAVATEPDPEAGRPAGLYGNAFARAEPQVVVDATSPIDPPTITNLIAMAALPPANGTYTSDQISYIWTTAHTAFTAASIESARSASASSPVVVHSGFWGCGAFGGNRVLMCVLQALAAQTAGIDRLVLHTGPPDGAPAVVEARTLLSDRATDGQLPTADVIEELSAMGFAWGVSDGN